jgi:protein-L-isoaspartate(D-aspartate) O-methyltransferase
VLTGFPRGRFFSAPGFRRRAVCGILPHKNGRVMLINLFGNSRGQRFEDLRRNMVARQLAGRDITDSPVLEAMRKVPRHLFVPEQYREVAYDDCPQPIGCGQTISQPDVVASMTQHLEIQRTDRVLEIGTGSGYQTAILAELCDNIWTIECVPELYERAQRTLKELSYSTVHMRQGDGTFGWPEAAPFDAILVTAAAGRVPEQLGEQLADRGRMVIPVESAVHEHQDLMLIRKSAGELRQTNLYPVRFVPLTSENRDR